MSILKQIQKHALATPDAAAICASDQAALSYQALVRQLDHSCEQLRAYGLSCDDRVALVLPNGPEMAVAFLAVSATHTCAPLNPGYRVEEFEYYLRDLGAAAVVVGAGTDSPVRQAAKSLGLKVLDVSKDRTHAGKFELTGSPVRQTRKAHASKVSEIALVLHTSGTTSKPKVVPLTHANLCSSAANVASGLQLSSDDRCLNIMPLFHIHGIVAALLGSLYVGGSVNCTSGLDVEAFFASWMPQYRPTWYTAVPTMHQALLQYINDAGRQTPLNDHCLRLIRSSSASLTPKLMNGLEAAFGVPVVEAYGMTEAAHQMASNPLPPSPRKAGSVGVAAGPRISIMAESDNQMMGVEEVGEIVVQGDNISAGYLDNDVANQNAFVDGWFRTGDQGRFDAEGYLFITGRLKEIVNRGGEKISPREVDEAVLAIAGVAQAVAFAVPHERLGEDLAVAVVLEKGITLGPLQIRDALFERIADFKIPNRIIIVDEIPKGATGKLQRIGLAEKLASRLNHQLIAPSNSLEELVAEIFVEVLQIERLGVTDNFFALGGDSLQGMQVTGRLSSLFQIELSAAILFRHPSVREIADRIGELLIAEDPDNQELVLTLKSLPATEFDGLLER